MQDTLFVFRKSFWWRWRNWRPAVIWANVPTSAFLRAAIVGRQSRRRPSRLWLNIRPENRPQTRPPRNRAGTETQHFGANSGDQKRPPRASARSEDDKVGRGARHSRSENPAAKRLLRPPTAERIPKTSLQRLEDLRNWYTYCS